MTFLGGFFLNIGIRKELLNFMLKSKIRFDFLSVFGINSLNFTAKNNCKIINYEEIFNNFFICCGSSWM